MAGHRPGNPLGRAIAGKADALPFPDARLQQKLVAIKNARARLPPVLRQRRAPPLPRPGRM